MNPLNWDVSIFWVWCGLFVVAFCRAGATYIVGRLARREAGRFRSVDRALQSQSYAKAEDRINRWGSPVVSVSFLTVGFQTAANLVSGATRMAWWRYIPALAVGAALWATLYSTMGFVGFEAVSRLYSKWPVGTVVGGIVGLVVLVIALVAIPRWRKNQKEARTSCQQ